MAKRNPSGNAVKKISVKTADANSKDKGHDQPVFGTIKAQRGAAC